MEAGHLFCGSCYGESYGATCGGCGSKIGGDELWVEALDQQWHSHCFTCTVRERGGGGVESVFVLFYKLDFNANTIVIMKTPLYAKRYYFSCAHR